MEAKLIIEKIKQMKCKNPLSDDIESDFTNHFIKSLSELDCIKDDKINKLFDLDRNNSYFSYNQMISELIVYFWLNRQGLKFELEKNKNIERDTNVDVLVTYKNINYNIEIKSPEFNNSKRNTIKGSFVNRFGDYTENVKFMMEFLNELNNHISQSNYEYAEFTNMTDNKVKSCLLYAQEKFGEPSNKDCNILFLSTTTSELISYWQYIINEESGFFNLNSDVTSFRAEKDGKVLNNMPLQKAMYNNVTAIILSNAITLNERKNNDSWNLSKAINIIIMNPFCNNYCISGLQNLSDFFPHNTCEFAKMLFDSKKTNPEIPELCHAYTFMAQNGFDVNKE